MFNGSGNETDNRGRWGDHTMTSIDPADGMTFWHVNQYLPSSGTGFDWVQRIGKFDFVGGVEHPRRHRRPHRPAAVGRPVRTFQVSEPVSLACFSQLMGSFTRWAG